MAITINQVRYAMDIGPLSASERTGALYALAVLDRGLAGITHDGATPTTD